MMSASILASRSAFSLWAAALLLTCLSAAVEAELGATNTTGVQPSATDATQTNATNVTELSAFDVTSELNSTDAKDVGSSSAPSNTSWLPSQLLTCINQAYQPKMMSWSAAVRDELPSLRALEVWWSAKPQKKELPVTVVTTSTLDRLPQLAAQCRSWPGAISAAVFVPVVELTGTAHTGELEDLTEPNRAMLKRAHKQVLKLFRAMESDKSMCRLDIVLVYEVFNDKQAQILFPVNSLRNLARLQARTPLVALVDVDLSISNTLHQSLMEDPEETKRMVERARKGFVYILPAFETVNDSPQAAEMADRIVKNRNKGFLVRAVRFMNALRPFASERYPLGHGCTNFDRWYRSGKKEYKVQWATSCEPWVIADRLAVPWHDVRFTGYGLNKVVHCRHMSMAGFQYVVHPTAFLVHRPHTFTAARVQWKKDFSATVEQNIKNAPQNYNMWERYNGLYAQIEVDTKAGTYRPMIDNANTWCSMQLPWWADLPKVQRN